jgi:phosphoribosylanthranilate isomerase
VARTVIQIYGVTTVEDGSLCAGVGVDHVGVAIDESGLAPDGVSVEEGCEILGALPDGTTRVALTFARDPDEIDAMLRAVHPDVLHISASLELVGVDQLKRLRRSNPEVRMMRAVSVDGPDSVAVAREFEDVADLLLLDTKDTGATTIGATGRTHDWALSAEIVETVRIPVILAGGLFAGNVAEAIGRVRPWGVDSYTLTSVDGDLRRKDPEKVKAFVSAVRQVGDQS